MKQSRITFLSVLFFAVFLIIDLSCGKKEGTAVPPDPCSGITVVVTGITTNPATPGASNGSITATATGGSGFTFSINGGPFQTSGTFSGLTAGTFTITAKNSNGCTGSAAFALTDPNPCAGITILVNGTISNPTAPGSSNGSVTVTASGSSGFTYNINGGTFQVSNVFSNLAAGSYVIIAKDINGCTGSSNFTLTASNPCNGINITVNGTVTNPSAPGASNGNIVATATGSTGFTYNINGGAFQSSGTFNNLAAGSYTITAKDANSCVGSATFLLTDPNPCSGVTITVGTSINGTDPCMAPGGMITASGSGGTGPYTFSLNSGAFQSNNIFTNLSSGNYNVSAKDINNCVGTVTNILVPNLPAGPLFSAVRTLIQNNCVSCHNPTNANGGMIWTVDCNIVTFKDRIQARAVNGNPSPMPPTGLLPASERQKITDWINAGGRFTD